MEIKFDLDDHPKLQKWFQNDMWADVTIDIFDYHPGTRGGEFEPPEGAEWDMEIVSAKVYYAGNNRDFRGKYRELPKWFINKYLYNDKWFQNRCYREEAKALENVDEYHPCHDEILTSFK